MIQFSILFIKSVFVFFYHLYSIKIDIIIIYIISID